MRIVGVQEATESVDCVVPMCVNEATRDGRCAAHNRVQDDLESFWRSDRKETPVPRNQGEPEPNDPFFQKCVEQIREFHAIVGRWPVPADAVDFPQDLPPKSNALPWAGGWQPLWDAVGAGRIPGGRGGEKYRRDHPVDPRPVPPPPAPEDRPVVTVDLEIVDDLVEAAVSPHQDDETPDDPGVGPDVESASEAVQAPDTPDPAECAACGSPFVEWDPADGWSCAACGRTDADEIDQATAAACPDGEACVCGGRDLCDELDTVTVADDILDPGPQPGQYESLVEVDPESEATDPRPFLRPALDDAADAASVVNRAVKEMTSAVLRAAEHHFGHPVDGVALEDGEVVPLVHHERDPESFAVASERLELATLALEVAQEEFLTAYDVWENHPVQQLISANIA